jgi:hypothetical protein
MTSPAVNSRASSSPALARSESARARAFDAGSSDGFAAAEARPASALVVTRAPLPAQRATGALVSETPPKHDKGERTGHSSDKLEKLTRAERIERPSKIERTEKPERLERIDRVEKPERLAKVDKVERPNKPEKPARPGR